MAFPRTSTLAATVLGIGYFPIVSGTIMSAIAMPLAVLIAMYGGGMGVLGAALAAVVIGIPACEGHVRHTGRNDPPECVIDELAGQWLACAFCLLTFGGLVPGGHLSVSAFALAFLLFRLFDIWKPGPVGWADRVLGGGVGVMTDDIIAGLMAGIIIVAVRLAVPL